MAEEKKSYGCESVKAAYGETITDSCFFKWKSRERSCRSFSVAVLASGNTHGLKLIERRPGDRDGDGGGNGSGFAAFFLPGKRIIKFNKI